MEALTRVARAVAAHPARTTTLLAATVLLAAVGFRPDHLLSGFLGAIHVDQYGTQWFYWFTERAVLEGHSLAWTDLFFFPFGKDIYRHTGANVLDALVAVPFRLLFGRVLGYNLFCLFFAALAGWSFHRLAREFCQDRLATGLGAVAFAACPFVIYELREGRPTQALLFLLPLVLLQALRTARGPGLRAPLLGGVLLALSAYQYWFYGFFGGLALLVLGGVATALPGPRAGPRHRVLGRFALMGIVALALCAPVALPLVLETAAQDETVPGLLDLASWTWTSFTPLTEQGATVGVFTWQPLHGTTGAFSTDTDGTTTFSPFHHVLPWVAWLGLLGWLARPGALPRRFGLALLIPLVGLATGPVLVLGAQYLVDPIWGAMLHGLAFLRRLWWPSRAMAWMTVLVVLVGVLALEAAGRRGPRTRAATLLLGGGAWFGHLLGNGLLPLGTWEADIPAGYECLAHGGDEALLELPWSWTQAHLYYQVHHGRPIFGGMLENSEVFSPPETVALRTENSFIVAMMTLASEETDVEGWTLEDLRELGDLGYGFIVLQKDAYVVAGMNQVGLVDNARRTRLRRMRFDLAKLGSHPIYEDARLAIYSPWGLPLPCADALPVPDTESGQGVRVVSGGDEKKDISDRIETSPFFPSAAETERDGL